MFASENNLLSNEKYIVSNKEIVIIKKYQIDLSQS